MMLVENYLLDENNEPYVERNMTTWAMSLEDQRHIKFTDIKGKRVSTVFLGIDHRIDGDGPPLLFETMVFSKDAVDEYTEKYATHKGALLGHTNVVRRIEEGFLGDEPTLSIVRYET